MRRNSRKSSRSKVSTTIAPENYQFLRKLISSGRAQNLAEALDAAISSLRKVENRSRLERATAEYFASMSSTEQHEERELAEALYSSTADLDFDVEP